MKPIVVILMGSDSDLEFIQGASQLLDSFGITNEMKVLSAHRSPDLVADFAKNAEKNGIKIIIAGAGGAAHLAGVVASHTTLPVVGVPIPTQMAGGLDSLLSTVQMPSGVPVATVATGKSGASNAGILAVQMLALHDPALAQKLKEYKADLSKQSQKKDERLRAKLKAS